MSKANPKPPVIEATWKSDGVVKITIKDGRLEPFEWGKWCDAICQVPGPGATGFKSTEKGEANICFIKFRMKKPPREFVERCFKGIWNAMEFRFPKNKELWDLSAIYADELRFQEEPRPEPEETAKPEQSVANVIEVREATMIGVATGKLSFQEAYAELVEVIGEEFISGV